MAVYYQEWKSQLVKIPKMDSNPSIKKIVNYIFAYKEKNDIQKARAIVFEQYKKVPPKWMNYVPDGISKFFGWHKRYVEATEPLRRFLLCMDILHQDISSVIIKVYPTAKYSQSLRTIYQSYGYKVASEQFIPWEVYLLNHAVDNKLLIS